MNTRPTPPDTMNAMRPATLDKTLRTIRRQSAALSELAETHILMRLPFHRLMADVAAYERAVNMYVEDVDEIITALQSERDGRETLMLRDPSLHVLNGVCDDLLQDTRIRTEVIVKPLHPDRYPRLARRIITATKRRAQAHERYMSALEKESEIARLEYEANHPDDNDDR